MNEKAVGILQKYDVECYGMLILGLDWEKKDFNALYKWVKKLNLVFVNLQPLTPLRGTDLYEKYKKDFIVKEEEYEKWDLAHLVVRPEKISVRKYYWYTMVLYYKITANPVSFFYMVRKYGLHDTVKLSFGAVAVNNQYVKKLIEGIKKEAADAKAATAEIPVLKKEKDAMKNDINNKFTQIGQINTNLAAAQKTLNDTKTQLTNEINIDEEAELIKEKQRYHYK